MDNEKKGEKTQKPEEVAEENTAEKTGFPEDVDFSKFLGCGG